MTDRNIELTRRKVLGSVGAVGAVGVAGAAAGYGTSAFFSDQETFTNNQIAAGELDMKVGYSDWMPNEEGTPEDEGVDVVMWDGAPGTTGGPDAVPDGYTGLPTNAAWLIAVDDPEQFLENTQYLSDGTTNCTDGTDAEAVEQPVIDLGDVKPGDFGEVTFDFILCDNPGYVWLEVGTATASENSHTEPELDDGDESGPSPGPVGETVELLDVVQAAVWVDDGNNYQNVEETPAVVGSLREVLGSLSWNGVGLDGDIDRGTGQNYFSAETTHSVALAWWVPIDHGNEIQTDSAEFSLNFYTEQCRHNDGSRDRLSAFLNDEMELKESPNWDGSVADRTGEDVVTVDNNALTTTAIGDAPLAFDPLVVRVDTGTEVVWEWVQYDESFPPFFNEIPHNVVGLDGPAGFNSGAPVPAGTGDPVTYSFTFTDPGTYLYYCTPHGAPEFVHSSPDTPFDEVINEFGMRGAVIVE